MTGRNLHKEWIGRRPESMPTVKVLLRLFEAQDGICACGCGTKMDFELDQIDCDHRVALKDGGANVESNLQLLLRRHHVTKTSAENVARAEAERHKAKAFTIVRERRQKIQSAGFRKAPPQRTATTPVRRNSTTHNAEHEDQGR